MRKSLLTIFVLSSLVICFVYLGSCRQEQNIDGLELMPQETPTGFPQPAYTFADNPLTKEGFDLGKKLFYDGRLSIDNEHSCASCHQQIAAFGTFEHDLSHGVNNSHTLRNAPVLFNLAWDTSYNWDGKLKSLTDVAAHKINGMIEMGESYAGVIAKLEQDKEYRDMFKKVFRYPFIRPEYILKALAQFTGYLVSANSKYDQYKKGLVSYTTQEERGYQLFRVNCASCHAEPLFTDHSFRNIGLPLDNFLNDFGRMNWTAKREDSLKFQVPTLRNSDVSSNYMHDGRFNTLLQCINHYRSGVQVSPSLDPLLTNGITLSNADANDIAVFLRTLTDSTFITDPRYR